MIKHSLCVVIMVLLFAESAAAQSQRNLRYVVGPSQALCKTAGGQKTGELYLNTPVKVERTAGNWTKVVVEGWVRTTSLRGKSVGTRDKYLDKIKENRLVIAGYKTKKVSEGLSQPRIYLTLTLKNNSLAHISSWSGLLVALTKEEKVLFREPLSDGKANIPPGGTGETLFYWEPHEPPYGALTSATKESLELRLYKVKLN